MYFKHISTFQASMTIMTHDINVYSDVKRKELDTSKLRCFHLIKLIDNKNSLIIIINVNTKCYNLEALK